MGSRLNTRNAILGITLFTLVCSPEAVPAKPKDPDAHALRWAEGQPGCTFSSGDDGNYRYGLWTDDFGITLAVDSQELQKVARRVERLFAVFLIVHYRGKQSLRVRSGEITLEFVSHFHEVHQRLDPETLPKQLQNDADAMAEATEKEIRRHPEKKAEKETMQQDYQKNVSETIEFLENHTLRPLVLTPDTPETTGWVFFSTRSKFVGDLKKQEQFVLRIPVRNRVVEFPFTLPPSEDDWILRRRPTK